MITKQLIAYLLGVSVAIAITFFLLRAICLVFLERKRRKALLGTNPSATPQEIDEDFQQYFEKFKRKLYVILAIVSVLIYIIVSK